MILTFLVRGYILIGVIFFSHCLRKFLKDKTTSNTDKSSWIVLGLATVLWPIVLPISQLERRGNRKVYSDEQCPEVEYRMTAPPLVERHNAEQKLSLTSASASETRSGKKNTTNIA
ncbi:MAG: hypothetical protein VKK42_28730 [Lyngbya sp.]|nr:hypothetical protein [Lyngbya sp.]